MSTSSDRNLASTSPAFIDASLNGYRFYVSPIRPGEQAILLNSHPDVTDQDTSALHQRASTFGEIDKARIVCEDSRGKLQLGSAILRSPILRAHKLEPHKSQWQQRYAFLTETTDTVLDGCDVGVRTGSNFVQQLKTHPKQNAVTCGGQSQNSKLLSSTDRDINKVSGDKVFGGGGGDRLFGNRIALLECLQYSTDKTLLSPYRVSVLHSTQKRCKHDFIQERAANDRL